MENIEKIKEELKKILSKKRYNHSIGVMNRAEELAKIYNVDIETAKIVGLTHDIAKEMTSEEKLKYAKDKSIFVDEIEQINTSLLHGKIGADICKDKYNFTEEMQKAIEFHTTTDKNMDMLAKIIYVADKTEDNRNSKEYDVSYERNLANDDIDSAIIYIVNSNIKSLIKKEKCIHPKAVETRNFLLINKSKKL